MKTAALLPTPGDPFHVLYWLRNYERVWLDEVDELRVLVNGQPDKASRALIADHVQRVGGVYSEYTGGGQIGHGAALNILLHETDADLVVLMEDDAPVRERGAIHAAMRRIREGECDVLASPRVSMSPQLEQAAQERFGTVTADDGDYGHGMWPAFVFTRRDVLLDTDRNFGARGWNPGMEVPGLGHVVTGDETVAADTFGGTALQLRARYRCATHPQWKGPWRWEGWLNRGRRMEWFHIGSLSASNVLVADPADYGLAEGRRLTDEMELGEWAHRLHWWQRFLRTAPPGALPDRQANYRANLDRVMDVMGVDERRLRAWDHVVDRMVTWDEQP